MYDPIKALRNIAKEICKSSLKAASPTEQNKEIARAHGVCLAMQEIDESIYASIELDRVMALTSAEIEEGS